MYQITPASASDEPIDPREDAQIKRKSFMVYGFMISSVITVCAFAINNGWDYGPVTFLSILSFITFFIILERLDPYEKGWHPTWKEWLRDGSYFSLVCMAGAFGQGLVLAIALYLAAPEGFLPLYAEIPAALLISTFGGYWFHRIGHENIHLWQVHGIHHVPLKVNLANNSVTHFIDIIGPAIVTSLPLLILGFSEESMFITSMFTAMQGYFVHANVNMRMGWLSKVIATPEAHRLHHSLDLKQAGNFSSDIMLWDWLFHSFTWSEGVAPENLGICRPQDFPTTGAIHKNILHPFVYIFRKLFSSVPAKSA